MNKQFEALADLQMSIFKFKGAMFDGNHMGNIYKALADMLDKYVNYEATKLFGIGSSNSTVCSEINQLDFFFD